MAPEEDVRFLHPLWWTGVTTLRRLCPQKNQDYNCPPSLAVCGNPFPKMIRGRRTLALQKEGRPPLRGDGIFIFGLLARLSGFFYLWPVRAL
jgi:hypothetical protein